LFIVVIVVVQVVQVSELELPLLAGARVGARQPRRFGRVACNACSPPFLLLPFALAFPLHSDTFPLFAYLLLALLALLLLLLFLGLAFLLLLALALLFGDGVVSFRVDA